MTTAPSEETPLALEFGATGVVSAVPNVPRPRKVATCPAADTTDQPESTPEMMIRFIANPPRRIARPRDLLLFLLPFGLFLLLPHPRGLNRRPHHLSHRFELPGAHPRLLRIDHDRRAPG